MGLEAKCRAWLGSRSSLGKALLESDRLLFRGSFRFDIPFKEIRQVIAEAGRLKVTSPVSSVTLELGQLAPKWALKISKPKTLLDKLGVRQGLKVSILGVKDPDFCRQLSKRIENVSQGRALKNSDIIFFQAENKVDLGKLSSLRKSIKSQGAIWLITPKGNPRVKESDAIQEGRAAGLVDVKVVSFSGTHTAHRFVVPLSKR